MEYRKAKQEELKEIIHMKNEVKKRIEEENLPIWLDGYPQDEYIEEDIKNGSGRVILDHGQLVGYACFHEAKEEYPEDTFQRSHLMSFSRIMVKSEYIGKSYGSYFISSMIEETKQKGYAGLGILVDSCNKRAVHLYQKFGFQMEGSRQFPFAYLDIYALYFKK